MVTPSSVFDYDMVERGRTLKKTTPITGGYEADQYETRRLWATALTPRPAAATLPATATATATATTALIAPRHEISNPRLSKL